MADRTTERLVTFTHPFSLSGFDTPEPAGTYRVVTDEAEILGLSFLAYQHVATMLHTPAITIKHGPRQVHMIVNDELAAALLADGAYPV